MLSLFLPVFFGVVFFLTVTLLSGGYPSTDNREVISATRGHTDSIIYIHVQAIILYSLDRTNINVLVMVPFHSDNH